MTVTVGQSVNLNLKTAGNIQVKIIRTSGKRKE